MKQNVLLLVIDSLRYDAIFGPESDGDTPTLDRLASGGISFTNCISHGISTAPAMTAMLTGRLPLDYGGHWHLDPDQPTFAEAFRANGYKTGAIHSNPYVSSRRNFDKGFDYFDEDVVAFEPDKGLERAPDKLLRIISRISRVLNKTPYTPAKTVNKKAHEFLSGEKEPWFLWTHYMDVHGPYLGGDNFSYPNKFRAEWLWRKAAVRDPDSVSSEEASELKEKYNQEVKYVDTAIGELIDQLEKEDSLEDTIVVVTADHGDEFYEHGRYGHGNLPYDELTRVPLIIRPPKSNDLPRGVEVDELVRSMDILPTVLDIVDAEIPEELETRLEGDSLLPSIRGEDQENIPAAITEKRVRGEEALRIAFRTENWKYVYDGVKEDTYLYNLELDQGETNDVSGRNEQILREFEKRLEDRFERIEETSENIETPELENDSSVEERLKALGYRD